MFRQAEEHVKFVAKVNKAWKLAKNEGFNVIINKAQTFRFLSQFFDKSDMSKVGTAVLKQAGMI